jgi:hypothetical protein
LFGLPTPVYPELIVNRQPAVQYVVQTVGQSADRAYTYVLVVPPIVLIATGPPLT